MIALGTAGCGTTSPIGACTAGNLTTSTSGSPSFTLSPTDSDVTIYPGQTKQLSVMVAPVGSAKGTVQLNATTTAQGLAISGTTATIGSVANLTMTAPLNVAADCFLGIEYVYTAERPITLTGTAADGTVKTQLPITIVLENPDFVPAKTNLPVLSITTTGGAEITSEDDYVTASMTLVDPTNTANNYSGTLGIKGHGNSTWFMPKKPYRLNLDSKAKLLGMTSDSNWILLANYDDKAMLRTDVSFQMSQMFGMAWTPTAPFVEMYLNGIYNGTYQLSEKVEVSKARLNIGSIDEDDNSGTNLTGGYLAEIDHNDGETVMLTSQVGLPIGIADPDPPTDTQASYFTTAFKAAEASMYSTSFTSTTTGWPAYWDQSSLVNWFLIEELAGNEDADDWSSDYFYKPRGDGLFYRGPVWDMDVTFGNVDYTKIADPTIPWVRTRSKWYAQLFQDPAFVAAVKAQWVAVRPQVLTLPAYIDTRATALNQAAQNNYGRWPTLGQRVWPNTVAAGTYQGEVDFMKAWLNDRIAYMDANYLQ